MSYYRTRTTRTDLQALSDSATITPWPPAVHVEGETPTFIVAVGGVAIMLVLALRRRRGQRRSR